METQTNTHKTAGKTAFKECAKCEKIADCKETPSGFEICRECWEKETFFAGEFK